MTNFKLLAIRPLKGCHRRFAKNLTIGQIYPIYSSYSFYDVDMDKIIKPSNEKICFIANESNFPNTIYDKVSADGYPLKINISALAGKNGSGKSTLIELLFAAIYLHSVGHDILEPNIDSLKADNEEYTSEKETLLEREKKNNEFKNEIIQKFTNKDAERNAEAFVEFQADISKISLQEQQIQNRRSFIGKELSANKRRIKDIKTFAKELKVEIYFELNELYYRLEFIHNVGDLPVISAITQVKDLNKPKKNIQKINLDRNTLANHFFYSIAVNYSHYALNSFNIGEWITSLFHKNDGYTTPIVINPMRTDGNFDINSEMNFARYRLLTNKLLEWDSSQAHDIYVTENHFIHYVTFTLNWHKVNALPKKVIIKSGQITGKPREVNMLTTFLADYFDVTEQAMLLSIDFPLKEIIINYIINKIDSIPNKYPWFGQGYQLSSNTPFIENEKFFELLLEDGSHITYKLKQAVNFLKCNLSTVGVKKFNVSKTQIENGNIIHFSYTLDEIMQWMGKPKGSSVMTSLPPSIFDIDFELSNNIGSTSLFSGLSSGEQQLVHTIQSVVYHLNNLQSAHLGKGSRTKYNAINIVYDEIELYFHPDYQRRFIADLLKEFERFYLNSPNSIKAINILLLTHSPFILSDIPDENILLLELDRKTRRSIPKVPASQTFAANINDLLADGFFLKGTLMGQFAEDNIKKAIERIKSGQATEQDTELLHNVGDSFLRASLENFKRRHND